MPAAGRHPGVDAGLRAGHGDGARRDTYPGDGAPRDVEAGVGHPEIGEPRREPDDEHPVVPARMDPDQLLDRNPDPLRHVGEVLAVIDAGDLQQTRLGLGFPAGAAGEVERVGPDGIRVRLRIVEDEHRAEGGNRFPVAREGLPFEQRGERGGLLVQFAGDLVPELDGKRGFTRVPETRLSPAGHRYRIRRERDQPSARTATPAASSRRRTVRALSSAAGLSP